MYKRSGAKITEIKANHLVYISQPGLVASVIETAALRRREYNEGSMMRPRIAPGSRRCCLLGQQEMERQMANPIPIP
jgi:hypothetical protein